MFFQPAEIELCRALKKAGLAWEPRVGQFVLDEDNVFHHTSPFQSKTFFILDLDHFLRYTKTEEVLKQRMVWLPTWLDARRWLRDSGVPDSTVQQRLVETRAIEESRELEVLLQMMLDCLTSA